MEEPTTRKWRLGRLGTRMLAAFLVVALVPLLLSALLAYWGSAAVVDRYMGENVGKTARSFAADVDLFLERQRLLLRSVPTGWLSSGGALEAAVQSDPNLEALFVLGPGGAVLARSEAEVEAWALGACASSGTSSSGMTHAGPGHAHEVVVGVPRDGGMLCGQVSFTLHQDLLSERAESIAGGIAYIVDRSGRVVCHAFDEGEPHVERGALLGGRAAEVASRGQAWSGMEDGPDGPVFAAFAPAKGLTWGVWVQVRRDIAAGPLRAWLAQSLLYPAALGGIAAVLALVFVRRLVTPVQDVVSAVRRVADGRYGESVPVRGDDEIAELAREFNRMTAALQGSYAELDRRVSQRTGELRAAREFSDLLLDTMRERILVIDDELQIVRANDAARAAFGDDVVGCGCKAVHERSGGTSDACPARRVLETGRPESEERVYERGGRTEILAVDTYPIPGPGGRATAVVEISRDITEDKRIQAQLVHQEKMAALGALAAGLAHEIGNPLASMSSELEMLERMWNADEARASLPVLRDQVRRISSLLRELVEFGRSPADQAATFAPRDVLEDVVRLLRHDPRCRGVDVSIDADPDVECVCTSRDRLVQVLVNLGLNALAALDGTGRVTFRVGPSLTGGVRFEVADDGPGLSEDVVGRAFDPFFTTKPPGKGTGLGLFVSERIVEGLGGRMELRNRAPRGATFAVVLPSCNCDGVGLTEATDG